MSQTPYQPPAAQGFVPQQPRPFNVIGLVGFILSLAALLLSLVTCGFGSLGSPIGLLISLVGLFKAPRGFAVAGTVLGGIGSVVLLLFSGSILALIVGGRTAIQTVETASAITQARDLIKQHRASTGQLPDGVEGNKLILHIKDGWKRELRYDGEKDMFDFMVRSAGPDGKFDTNDDITEGIDGGVEIDGGTPFEMPDESSVPAPSEAAPAPSDPVPEPETP